MTRHAMARGERLPTTPLLAVAMAVTLVLAPEAARASVYAARDGSGPLAGQRAGAAPAGIRLAQESDHSGSSSESGPGEADGGDRSSPGTPAAVPLTGAGTAAITTLIFEASARCDTLAVEYRIPCLAGELRRAASAIGPGGDYQEAKTVLNRTARRLDAIARNGRDPAKRPARPAGGSRAYPAVRTEVLRQATQQAVQVIREAETRLLRSAESSERRRVHYQNIARALGSTTRILRS